MNKNLKARIILFLLVLIFGTILAFYLSTYMHLFLVGEFDGFKLYDVEYILNSFKLDSNHSKLFLCLEIFVLLISGYFLLLNDKPYQSDLIVVTPQISTPKPAGQKQFGSARWMTVNEKGKEFRIAKIKRYDSLISNLIEQASIEVNQTYHKQLGGDHIE